MISETLRLLIDDLNKLRDYYRVNGEKDVAQGVQAAIALLEDYGVDTWGNLVQWHRTTAPRPVAERLYDAAYPGWDDETLEGD